MPPPSSLIVTCEHGGNRIPRRLRPLFADHAEVLATHRGYDIGALPLARALARTLRAPLLSATTSRLVVDLNRSVGHPRLFSDVTRRLPPDRRADLLAEHYQPHRQAVTAAIADAARPGRPVLHLAVHTFTPILDGRVRDAHVGLLYDPHRALEVRLCQRWRALLNARYPDYIVRRNYPYRGTADGLATALRRRFEPGAYGGVELEVNQQMLTESTRRRAITRALIDTLSSALA